MGNIESVTEDIFEESNDLHQTQESLRKWSSYIKMKAILNYMDVTTCTEDCAVYGRQYKTFRKNSTCLVTATRNSNVFRSTDKLILI